MLDLIQNSIQTFVREHPNYGPTIQSDKKLIWKSEASKAPIVVQVHATDDLETTVITGYDQENQPILAKLSAA